MASYDIHPLADLFPELETASDAFKALVDDIREREQQEPIVLFEGKVLDGRSRARACSFLKREPIVKDHTGNDPIGFVLSANLHRRHLNESQRAMVGAKLTKLALGANQHTKGQGPSIEEAAKLLNVGHASIERAKKVLGSGNEQLVKDVQDGKRSVSAAAEKVETGGKKRKRTEKQKVQDRYKAKQEELIDVLQDFPSWQHAEEYAERTKERLDETVHSMQGEEKEVA
jgi:ParB-like chromosome segregation protein Spo0J